MGILDQLFEKHGINQTNNLARALTQPIRRFGATTSFNRAFYRPNFVHQIDLLFLPEDYDKSRYLLVCVDIGSGIVDARALKNKEAKTVLNAMIDIYRKKKYLPEPKRIHADAGTEFSEVIKYFRNRGVGVRVAAAGKHSQQAIVENMNKTIGGAIMKLQLNNELITGQQDTDWVSYLDDILKIINSHAKQTKKPLPAEDDNADIKCDGADCDILQVGTLVRTRLNYPRDIGGSKLHGVFRSGDYRWSLTPSKITNVLMFPNQPVRYVVEGYTHNTFAKWELMIYTQPKEMRMTDNQFIVEKIVRKATQKNQKGFVVKWKGYADSENSFVSRQELMRNSAPLVVLFEGK